MLNGWPRCPVNYQIVTMRLCVCKKRDERVLNANLTIKMPVQQSNAIKDILPTQMHSFTFKDHNRKKNLLNINIIFIQSLAI